MESRKKNGGLRKCIAYRCGLEQTKDCKITFHGFPLADKELCAKWIHATKWEGFVPTKNHFLCRQHFKPDDFYFSDSKKPKKGAVPSLFQFPVHGQACVGPTIVGTKRGPPLPRPLPEVPEKKTES